MKTILLLSGFFSLGLGVVGIVLPILPTTPFLLLTAFLFSKSSTKFKDWFESTKIYQKYLQEFIENQTMTKRQRWTLNIIVDVMLLLSFISVDFYVLKALLIVIFLFKHWYFYKFVKSI